MIDLAKFGALCDAAGDWPLPGSGGTADRWSCLIDACRRDLVVGRLVEAHADAVAILCELGAAPPAKGERWGVWAAGPVDRVQATAAVGSWRLDGVKPWCSGATLLTHALVEAAGPGGSRRLFAIDLSDEGVEPGPPTWKGSGMASTDTRSVTLRRCVAAPVGDDGQYLDRPGFWVGSMGVAACWHGGTIGVGRRLLESARTNPKPYLLMHLGAVSTALFQNRACLDRAAHLVNSDAGAGHPADIRRCALELRQTVERNAGVVMDRVGRALGAGPLAHDGEHAQLVADLATYVRQHHAEIDLEAIGAAACSEEQPWS